MVLIVGTNLPSKAGANISNAFDAENNASVFLAFGVDGAVVKADATTSKWQCAGVIESVPVDNEDSNNNKSMINIKEGEEVVTRRYEVVNIMTEEDDIPVNSLIGADANGKAKILSEPTDFDEFKLILGIARLPIIDGAVGVELTL